ncbi:MAG: magnetosome biogenesis transporter MamH [Rhodospirillaceae bacterium]
MAAETRIEQRWNALYLIAALTMIFTTLATALQPLFLRKVLGVSLDSAGMINANVEVAAELLTLVVIGSLGIWSDRVGRVKILTGGFAIGTLGALFAPLSFQLGALIGVGGVVFYYLTRITQSLGVCAVWPQLSTLAGDFTNYGNRARRISNVTSMMAFGSAIVFVILLQMPRHLGVVPVMLFNAAFGAAGAVLAYRLLSDIAPKRAAGPLPWQPVLALLKTEPGLRVAFVTALFSRCNVAVISLFYMLWSVYFADLVGKSPELAAAHAGGLIGLAGLLLVVTSLGSGLVIERLGRLNTIIAGMAISGTGFVLISLVTNPFSSIVLVPMALIALGQAGALLAPDLIAFDLTPRDLRGSIIGALNVTSGLGMIIMLEAGGWLFDTVGPDGPFVLVGAGNFLVMAYAFLTSRQAAAEPAPDPFE